jgi:alpha-methylacyl-CoA racemase
MGILLALIERNNSGKGQVVDAAMVDGAANISTFFWGLLGNQLMTLDIGTNMLDSGAPYYQPYETADGRFMSVGAIEGRFYAELLKGLELDPSTLPYQHDKGKWPEMRERFAEVFKRKTRDEWVAIFDGTDACVAPILDMDEVENHRHNKARDLLVKVDGIPQPGPAPRLSRTPGSVQKPGMPRGSETREILKELGYTKEDMEGLLTKNIVE